MGEECSVRKNKAKASQCMCLLAKKATVLVQFVRQVTRKSVLFLTKTVYRNVVFIQITPHCPRHEKFW